jgi:hypothetical protein
MPPTGDDHRQHGRQLFRHLQIALVAGLVEGGKDVVGYAPAVTAFPVGLVSAGGSLIEALSAVRRKPSKKKARPTRRRRAQITQTYQDLADPLDVFKNTITGFVSVYGTMRKCTIPPYS